MTQTIEHFAPQTSEAARYRAILDKKIHEGARSAQAVIEAINRDIPHDQIGVAAGLKFFPSSAGINVGVGDAIYVPSDFAVGQIAEKAGMPGAYLRKLLEPSQEKNGEARVEEQAWRRELAAHALREHFANTKGRILARSVRGQLRGLLSDRYRRLDSRPLVDALCGELIALGAQPYSGTATETRVAIKALVPEIFEPIPGEFMVSGLEWSNSDFGNGTHSVRAFALRVVCLNGMTRENLLREIHLGKRLGDDVQYSDKTYQLDTEASVSALKDITRHALGPASRDDMVRKIREAAGTDYSERQLVAVTRNVGKATQKAIVDAFKSEDVINLPEGKTAWRASNAVSWIARHTASEETRLDLERLAGELV